MAESAEEVFKFFDSEGEGVKIKDIGTALRSLGLTPPNQVMDDFLEDARRLDGEFGRNTITLDTFKDFAARAQAVQKDDDANTAEDLESLRVGMGHFFSGSKDKSSKAIKMNDLRHVLSVVGEKFSEEELDDFVKEVKNNCAVSGGAVDFTDLKKLVMAP